MRSLALKYGLIAGFSQQRCTGPGNPHINLKKFNFILDI